MWRVFAGPLVGYIAMVVIVMSCNAAIWFGLGPNFAFDGETLKSSLACAIIMLIAGLLAAIVGGFIAAKIGGINFSRKAVAGLVGLVFGLGLITLIAQAMSIPPVVPKDLVVSELSIEDAARFARSPMWYNFAIVVVGVIGTFIGGSLKKFETDKNSSA